MGLLTTVVGVVVTLDVGEVSGLSELDTGAGTVTVVTTPATVVTTPPTVLETVEDTVATDDWVLPRMLLTVVFVSSTMDETVETDLSTMLETVETVSTRVVSVSSRMVPGSTGRIPFGGSVKLVFGFSDPTEVDDVLGTVTWVIVLPLCCASAIA